MHTKSFYEKQVLDEIKLHDGYISSFWITEHQKRAHAADRLIQRKKIIHQDKKAKYPFNFFKING